MSWTRTFHYPFCILKCYSSYRLRPTAWAGFIWAGGKQSTKFPPVGLVKLRIRVCFQKHFIIRLLYITKIIFRRQRIVKKNTSGEKHDSCKNVMKQIIGKCILHDVDVRKTLASTKESLICWSFNFLKIPKMITQCFQHNTPDVLKEAIE